MKKSRIVLILIMVLLVLFGYKLLSNDNKLPTKVVSVSVVNTDDNSKTEITGADSERLLQLANGSRNYFEYPACMGSNTELQFHTKVKTFYRKICGDDCGTLWNRNGKSFSISNGDMREIKDILSKYDIEVLPR